MNLIFEDEVSEDLEDIPEELENRILREVFGLENNPLPGKRLGTGFRFQKS